ncbi:MAG: septum formation inhibitor Maf [Peptococcaceae bacterium]|nr:septum formation inhibitor Maf [Peptococcaceae bacterium]
MDFVLASASPRRFELLQQVGAKFTVQVSEVQEVIDPALDVQETVQSLAWQKAKAVAATLQDGIVLGADTIVVSEGVILGKPKTKEEAKEMLTSLSGKWHEVMTGVALIDASGKQKDWQSVEVTRVKFRNLTEQDIAAYIATNECMDKAGAYGIQGFGALLVEQIAGCYFNVVGLPLQRVAAGLFTMGVNLYDYGYKQL